MRDPADGLLAVSEGADRKFIGFRVLTPRGIPARKLVPGAVAGGAAWTVLQVLGTYLVRRFLHSDSVYGVFGTVLGLLAWIYLAVEITVCAAEINVVLARRLWPRSIVQPPLTEADRAVLAAQALQNQRRDDQHVDVSFDDPAAGVSASGTTPQTADEDFRAGGVVRTGRSGRPARVDSQGDQVMRRGEPRNPPPDQSADHREGALALRGARHQKPAAKSEPRPCLRPATCAAGSAAGAASPPQRERRWPAAYCGVE